MLGKLYRDLFRAAKHTKKADKVDKSRVAMSALALFACCMAFCASTFAWFTSSQTSQIEAIETGSFDVVVTSGDTQLTASANSPTTHTLAMAARDRHRVTITAEGTAPGYCIVKSGGRLYRAYPLEPGDSVTLNIEAAENTDVTFYATWSQPDEAQAIALDGGADSDTAEDEYTIHISETPHDVYAPIKDEVIFGALLDYYKVSVEQLCLYNGVDSAEQLLYMEIWVPNRDNLAPLTILDYDALGETPTDESEETDETETPDDEQETRPDDTTDDPDAEQPSSPDDPATPTPTETPEPSETPTETPSESPEPSESPTETPEASEAPAEQSPEPSENPDPVSEITE